MAVENFEISPPEMPKNGLNVDLIKFFTIVGENFEILSLEMQKKWP